MTHMVFSLRSILLRLRRGRQRSFGFSAAAELAPTPSSGLKHPRRPDIVPAVGGDIEIPSNPKAALAKIDIRCENHQGHSFVWGV